MSEEFVTVNQTAELLGVSRLTIRRRISDGTINAYRVGRFIRIPRTELDKLLSPIPAGGASK